MFWFKVYAIEYINLLSVIFIRFLRAHRDSPLRTNPDCRLAPVSFRVIFLFPTIFFPCLQHTYEIAPAFRNPDQHHLFRFLAVWKPPCFRYLFLALQATLHNLPLQTICYSFQRPQTMKQRNTQRPSPQDKIHRQWPHTSRFWWLHALCWYRACCMRILRYRRCICSLNWPSDRQWSWRQHYLSQRLRLKIRSLCPWSLWCCCWRGCSLCRFG